MSCRHTFRFSTVVVLILSASRAFAGFHGEVTDVHNLPGYIETNPQSAFYQGAIARKDRDDGIDHRSPSRIILDFFNGSHLDPQKINAYLTQIKGYRDNAYLVECQSQTQKTSESECKSEKAFQKKWKTNRYKMGLDFAQKQFEDALAQADTLTLAEVNSIKSQPVLEKLFSGVQTWEAIKAEDDQRSRMSSGLRGILNARNLVLKNEIDRDRPDASNLLVPSSHPLYGKQMFLSEQNLKDLRAQNYDLSLLDPPSTGMWRKPKKSIRDFNTATTDSQGMVQLRKYYSEEEAEAIVNPDREISVVYKPTEPGGGESPKLEVRIGKLKWKMKFITDRQSFMGAKTPSAEVQKLIWGSEANVEPVVNNLAAAIGFTIDPTYFKKQVRVYFEDEVYENNKFDEELDHLKVRLIKRYNPTINITSALSVIKTDEKGRKYIEMKSLSFEQKSMPDTDIYIGFFDHIGLGKDLSREHRAFYLFLAWICDLDVKNDNDSVKLVPTGDTYKVMDSSSDMGNGMALGMPNVYNFPFVKGVTRDSDGSVKAVQFTYPRYYPLPMQYATNINDAKWFARLLGQLTFPQMESAFAHAGYTPIVAKYYALLAAKKRNELLRSLDLIGTSFINSQGEKITLEALPEFTGTIAGYEQYFKDGLLTDPKDELTDPTIENWPRHWGTNRRVFGQDPQIEKEFLSVVRNSLVEIGLREGFELADRAVIHRDGFQFARIIDHRLGSDCHGDCFIQGLDFGLKSFIPMRFLVDNPHVKDEPKKPLWIIDLMRVGFYLGDQGEMLQSLLGFEPPSKTEMSLGSRAFKIYEIMKITPIESIDNYFDETKNFKTLPKYALDHLKEQVINTLDEGQTLIVSTYLGAEAQGRIRLPSFPLFSVRVGGNVVKVKRTTVLHKEGQYLVNWNEGNSSAGGGSFNLIDKIIRIPLLKQSWDQGKTTDQTYVFSDQNTEKTLMMQNLIHANVESLPETLRWENRKKDSHGRKGSASLFGLRTTQRFLNKVETHYENFKAAYSAHTKKLSLATENSRLRDIVNATWKKSAEVLLNQKGGVAVSLKFNLDYPAAIKEKILTLFENYRPYFPKDLFFFDVQFMKHYMGDVTGETEVLFTQEMLDRIFASTWSEPQVCAIFVKSCGTSFWGQYTSARETYQKISSQGMETRDRFMKRMARFFLDSNDALEFSRIALGSVAPIEHAWLESSLNAFPGDQYKIEWSANDAEKRTTTFGSEFDPTVFTDEIETSLKGLFFSGVMH